MLDLYDLLDRISEAHYQATEAELKRIDEEVSACTSDLDTLERYIAETSLDN